MLSDIDILKIQYSTGVKRDVEQNIEVDIFIKFDRKLLERIL